MDKQVTVLLRGSLVISSSQVTEYGRLRQVKTTQVGWDYTSVEAAVITSAAVLKLLFLLPNSKTASGKYKHTLKQSGS